MEKQGWYSEDHLITPPIVQCCPQLESIKNIHSWSSWLRKNFLFHQVLYFLLRLSGKYYLPHITVKSVINEVK